MIKFGEKDYALVPDRLKQFREDNPRGKIETKHTIHEDGSITFKAYILRDKADISSADATGTARYSDVEIKKAKAFEKLETISVGRALSLLGYLNDGQIASSEEMEEFEDYKNDRKLEAITTAVDQIKEASTIDELKIVFMGLGALASEEVIIETKDKRKTELGEK